MVSMASKHGPKYQAFTRRLREAREAAGLTQAQAARLLGKRQSFISKIESGERRLDIIELKTIADLYHTNLEFFESSL